MSHLKRLRDALQAQRNLTVNHPLDDTVTITYRPPTIEDHARARRAARGEGDERNIDRSAGMLADCLVQVAENGQPIATVAGRELATAVGLEWRERTGEDPGTTAADVIRAMYGPAWRALLDDATAVLAIVGRPTDPSR